MSTIIIYPAIDIKNGKCVRLKQGRFDEVTVYYDDPFKAAERWKEAGAKYLHIVDLDGARTGKQENLDIASMIARELGMKVQLGGGIRTMERIEKALKAGISRVVLGTAAVKNPSLVKEAVKEYGSGVAVGIDARDGRVAVEGWEGMSAHKPLELAKMMEQIGVETVIYTDISRDGMLEGPNFDAILKLREKTSMGIIASGGVSRISDIKRLSEIRVAGAIVGKALYTGDVDLGEALAVAAGMEVD